MRDKRVRTRAHIAVSRLQAAAHCLALGLLLSPLPDSVSAQTAPDAVEAATTLKYQVEVQAPRELKNMLEAGLDLVRWQDDPHMNAELLYRLLDEAVAQSRRAIATEGYFTPEIKGRIDDSGEPWRVIIEVTPGPRTIVREIDLDFFGPAVDDPEVQSLIEDARANWSLNVGEPFRQAE